MSVVQLPASDGSFVPEPPTIVSLYAETPCSPEASPSSQTWANDQGKGVEGHVEFSF